MNNNDNPLVEEIYNTDDVLQFAETCPDKDYLFEPFIQTVHLFRVFNDILSDKLS